jgi:hypothetical protein
MRSLVRGAQRNLRGTYRTLPAALMAINHVNPRTRSLEQWFSILVVYRTRVIFTLLMSSHLGGFYFVRMFLNSLDNPSTQPGMRTTALDKNLSPFSLYSPMLC